MEFRCGLIALNNNASRTNEEAQSSFGCFNGGICAYDAQVGEHCVCPEGWTHDVLGFGQFLNCTLPENFIRYFFIVFTILFWLTMAIVLKKMNFVYLRGTMRKVSIGCFFWCLSSWAHLVGVFVQDGYYEAALIIFGLNGIIGFWIASKLIPMLFVPIARRAGLIWLASISPTICGIVFVLESLSIICTVSAAAYYCRDPDPSMSNLMVVIYLGQVCIAVELGCLWILLFARHLRTLIPAEAVSLMEQLKLIFIVVGSVFLGKWFWELVWLFGSYSIPCHTCGSFGLY